MISSIHTTTTSQPDSSSIVITRVRSNFYTKNDKSVKKKQRSDFTFPPYTKFQKRDKFKRQKGSRVTIYRRTGAEERKEEGEEVKEEMEALDALHALQLLKRRGEASKKSRGRDRVRSR